MALHFYLVRMGGLRMTALRLHQHSCENCNRRCEERIYVRRVDEYWCQTCVDEQENETEERKET